VLIGCNQQQINVATPLAQGQTQVQLDENAQQQKQTEQAMRFGLFIHFAA